MGRYTNKQRFAIMAKQKGQILSICPGMPNASGIYFLTRTDENEISYFYIGQSVHMVDRMVSHMNGYQHIDLSLKSRGWYEPNENPYGWKLNYLVYPQGQLDEMEQYWILEYTKRGYQCRYNKTSGSQGEGKEKINEFRPTKTYRDGIQQGKKLLARDLYRICTKHLDITTAKLDDKRQENELEKFWKLISPETYEEKKEVEDNGN